jgi:hypothetical protein
MSVLLSTIAASGGVRQIPTGVVRSFTDSGPAYSFSRTVNLGGGLYSHYYNFTQKQERWYADVSIPTLTNLNKAIILLEGSAKCDDFTYFRRPMCSKIVDSTTIRIYADDTRAFTEARLYNGDNSATAPTSPASDAVALAWALANPGGPSSIISNQINGHDIRWTLVEYM